MGEMHDGDVLLLALLEELSRLDRHIVCGASLGPDSLSFFNGQAHIVVGFVHEADATMAHCHIVTSFDKDDRDSVDACCVGVDSDRSKAIRKAARVWIQSVAPSILSVLHAKSVLSARHFDGSQPWGVSEGDGFVGPMIIGGTDVEIPFGAFEDCGLFDFAPEIASPGNIHLARVALSANADGLWTRVIEVDGHDAAFCDENWEADEPAPPRAHVIIYAVFHYGGDQEKISERREIDSAIRRFVREKSHSNPLKYAGTPHRVTTDTELMRRVAHFTPLAFARFLRPNIGVEFSPMYFSLNPDGTMQQYVLMREPVFARSVVLAEELFRDPDLHSGMHAAANSTAESEHLNHALSQSKAVTGFPPPIIPQAGVSSSTLQKAFEEVYGRFPGSGGSGSVNWLSPGR